MNKKILYLAEKAHPAKQGGIETFGRVLKKMFTENIYCLAYQISPKKENHIVKDIIEIPCKGIYKYLNKITNQKLREFMLKNKISKLSYSISIFNYPDHINFFKKINCKKILVQHVNFELYYNKIEFFNKKMELINLIKTNLDCFVFLSEFDRQTFIKNLDFNKTAVIRHSSEVPLLKENKKKIKILL